MQKVHLSFEGIAERWPQASAYGELFEHLDGESERGSVLVVSAALDEALLALLEARLLQGRRTKQLLSRSGPVSAFSARIDLCFAVGAVNEGEQRLLHKIRKIRNDCAHVGAVDFRNASLKDKCLALELPYGSLPDERDPARRLVMIAQVLLLILLLRVSDTKIKLSDDPIQPPERTVASGVEQMSFEIRLPSFRRGSQSK